MREIKDRLYEIMSELNISQTDIVKKTGIPKSSMSMYLAGTRIPKQDKISLICEAYNINEAWLMGYENIPMIKTKQIINAEADANLLIKYNSLSENSKKEVINFVDYLYSKTQD